ncbi:MAG TPA: hypothetical protein PK141_00560, partial [Polyangiaceae bacterium]|nr:hypothetical protein [Polyangiaceae bacterium]
ASREAMVEPPATPAAPPAPAPSGATGGGGATITIGQVVFQVSGDEAGGKKAFAEFMSLLEVAAGQGGGMVPSG